ncbi:MAG: response regulator [Lachnospiraceae bacterium]|nr:response regulator [Lachnospiraceae bacterium]
MFGKRFELNEQTIPMIEEIGRHMPGGFFIYQAEGAGHILYVNKAVTDIYGCADVEEFRELTGNTFRGMVHPEDRAAVFGDISEQIETSEDKMDYVEYRIVRKDGTVRWVDDYGHYTETDAFGGIFYVFISDITDKRKQMESDIAVRQAVIEALSQLYHTVWLINDVETESFSLYRGDLEGDTTHALPIRNALEHMKYSQAKEFYINTMVAESDRERLQSELTLESIVGHLEERSQFNVNYLRIMDDGSERYFRIEFVRIEMPGGKMGVVCGFKDVDEEAREEIAVRNALHHAKEAEEENRRLVEEIESAAKLAQLMGSVASLLTNMPAMSFSKDAETGRYLACNQSFAEYAHKEKPEGVVGLTDAEIFDEETARHFVEDDQKALAMDEPYVFFEDVPDAVGNMRNLQTTKIKFTDADGRLCVLGMCVDVTEMTRIKSAEAAEKAKREEMGERRVLQEQLQKEGLHREQQERLITALAADYWSVYYLDLDLDYGICYQSHADLQNGFRVGDEFHYLQAVTDYANAYVIEAYRDEFLRFIQPDAIRAGLSRERVISYRYMVRRHGHESYEMVRFAGVRRPEDREDGHVRAVGACFTDVDAETRRALEQNQQLAEALTAAEQANKAKTAFLSNMSHEIRTPMNAIIGLNSIAMNDPETPEKTKEYLTKIGTSAQHLLNIINDILDMSRIESGRMVIRNEEFQFSKTLEQVNTMMSGQCRDKGLSYECRIRGHVDDYYIGDDMKIRQILINILGNAVKFTPPGGSVTFTVEETARLDGKSTLRFTIRDTGIGMSPEYLPRLFDTFSQEDSSYTNKYGSTGLGMPITKSIVELMNGTIDVESEKGKGSVFTVTITLRDSDRKAEVDPQDLFAGKELCVLVIDDDPVACEHAKLILGQVGVDCETAPSGEKGLEMIRVRHARRKPYNLILVDWKMPGMDGLETTRRIRELVGHEMPVIILTSYNWEDIEDEAKQAGVDSFVAKPLFAGTVMEEFRSAFRKREILQKEQRADLCGRRVLLAEDVLVNAEIIMMLLSMREIDVDLAENGRIAVEMFANSAPGYYDVILMDMRMPEMDGLEASRAIREMERADAGTIPIIALTANAFDEDVQRSMQAGLNAHLSKPVEPEILFATLENLLSD